MNLYERLEGLYFDSKKKEIEKGFRKIECIIYLQGRPRSPVFYKRKERDIIRIQFSI